MRLIFSGVVVTVTTMAAAGAYRQVAPRTLVAVWAHADDEVPVGPILARYAREGAQVYMIIATDGAQGASNTMIPRGPELARVRADEARCSAQALGAHSPIFLGFPDGALGSFTDPTLLYRSFSSVDTEAARRSMDCHKTQ